MANFLTTPGFVKGQAAHLAKGETRTTFTDIRIDFAAITAARAAAGVAPLAATNTLQLLPIPRGSVLLAAGIEVLRVETVAPTATVSLGFQGGVPAAATAYANAMALNALATVSLGVLPTLVNGIAENTTNLAVTIGTVVPANALIRVFALVADVTAG